MHDFPLAAISVSKFPFSHQFCVEINMNINHFTPHRLTIMALPKRIVKVRTAADFKYYSGVDRLLDLSLIYELSS